MIAYGTRLLANFGGLVQLMPVFSACTLFLVFANFSFPGTSSFPGELLILLGLYLKNSFIVVCALTSDYSRRCLQHLGVCSCVLWSSQ
jgi:NADH:ubiquinone oxidoreductase subunit 4 (subunit M)